jgi:glycosyltransferase involved in cell wall biosynthesis
VSFCYVAYSALDLASANSVQTYLTCRELLKKDPRVRILLPKSPRRPADSRGLAVTYLNKLPLRWLAGRRGEAIERRIFAARAARLAVRDHAPVYTRDDAVAAACVRHAHPVVLEVHSLAGLGRDTLAGVRCVVALNGVLAEQLRAEGAARWVEVIEDAFDAGIFHPRPREAARRRWGIPPGALVIGYCGLTFGGRGVDLLLSACEEIPSVQHRRLLLLGGRPEEREALGLARRPYVIAPGALSQEEVAQSLAAADVLAIPAIVNEIESSPLKMFEYAAMEIPIVAVDRAALRWFLGEEARYFPPGDRLGLAQALRDVVAEPQRWRERARRLGQRVAGYTYTERARRIVRLMGDVAIR